MNPNGIKIAFRYNSPSNYTDFDWSAEIQEFYKRIQLSRSDFEMEFDNGFDKTFDE